MSFLTPLYIAGALAVALPVLFHLIRRTPRGEIPFSSLMFLSPSPPRITRRSRIEHWLLLFLRGLALVLLAMAFSRPFLRQPAQANDADAAQQRVAIVIDTSASMRRGDLWTQAIAAVDAALAATRPVDQIGVYACDESLRPVVGFDELAQIPAPQRRGVVADRLKELAPTWASTHLGQGLLDAVAVVSDSHDDTEEAGRAARRLVLVSDMQEGGRLSVLGDAAWPADVQLELKRVEVRDPTNAGLWRLADNSADEATSLADGESEPRAALRKRELRIRVANAADSQAEQFELQWIDAAGREHGPATPAYVPAGESRVVRVARAEPGVDSPRLTLTGDAHDFDNALHIVAEDRRQLTVAYLGADAANDPQGLRYYVERAVTADPSRDVQVVGFSEVAELADDSQTAAERGDAPPLVVVTSTPTADQIAALRRYADQGGTLLYALVDVNAGTGLADLLGVEELPVEEADVDGYTMLGEIDFSHPLFAAMAGPQYNDFTQIRFWHYRRLDLAEAKNIRVAARFENRDPAVIEQRVGAGRIVAFAAGWQPSDGQLARSWKFLLMLQALIDDGGASDGFRTEYLVNERVALPDRGELAELVVTAPDGAKALLPGDATAFTAASQPGVYAFAGADGPIRFAVNLDPAESDTAPASAETFEQLGCRLVGRADSAFDAERLQQLRDVELEGRQRIWQWLVAGAICVLIVETVVAGRLSRRMEPSLAVG
jgi:hypothetical protein